MSDITKLKERFEAAQTLLNNCQQRYDSAVNFLFDLVDQVDEHPTNMFLREQKAIRAREVDESYELLVGAVKTLHVLWREACQEVAIARTRLEVAQGISDEMGNVFLSINSCERIASGN